MSEPTLDDTVGALKAFCVYLVQKSVDDSARLSALIEVLQKLEVMSAEDYKASLAYFQPIAEESARQMLLPLAVLPPHTGSSH